MIMKHKWHDEIVAWAGGAEIEFQYPAQDMKWEDWGDNPDWSDNAYNYRIKPQPKQPKYLYAFVDNSCGIVELTTDVTGGIIPKDMKYIGKIEVLNDD